MGWVFEESESEGSARLVLLSIANHASARGGNVFCGLNRLAQESRCSKSTVQRALDELEAMGEILIFPYAGAMGRGGRTNRYEMPKMPGWVPPLDVPEPRKNPCGYVLSDPSQIDHASYEAWSSDTEACSSEARSMVTGDQQTSNHPLEPKERARRQQKDPNRRFKDGRWERFYQGSGWIPEMPQREDVNA